MTMDRLFFAWMALAGAATGAVVTLYPQAQDFSIKPYFWVLIAVILFDIGVYLVRRNTPGPMLNMSARLLGFVIGIVLMVAVAKFAGSPVQFF